LIEAAPAHEGSGLRSARHRKYLRRLEALKAAWGPLAYGPGPEAVARSTGCAAAPGAVPRWTTKVIHALRTLEEVGAIPAAFCVLEIGGPKFSLIPAITRAFPEAGSSVLCTMKGHCMVHRFAGHDSVQVYDVDPRQIIGTPLAGKPNPDRGFDVVILLDSSIVSPLQRPAGGERFLPELAIHWLNGNARVSFIVARDGSDLVEPGLEEQAARIAISPDGLAILCRSSQGEIPELRQKACDLLASPGA
jgi:hypothetical protein